MAEKTVTTRITDASGKAVTVTRATNGPIWLQTERGVTVVLNTETRAMLLQALGVSSLFGG